MKKRGEKNKWKKRREGGGMEEEEKKWKKRCEGMKKESKSAPSIYKKKQEYKK